MSSFVDKINKLMWQGFSLDSLVVATKERQSEVENDPNRAREAILLEIAEQTGTKFSQIQIST